MLFHGSLFQRKHRYLQCFGISAPTLSRTGICCCRELRIRLLSLYISWEKPFSLRLAAKFQNERMLWCWIKFDMCHSFGENGIHQNCGFCIDPSHHFPPHLSCSSYESHDTGEVYFSFLATSYSYFFPFILSWLLELNYQEENVKVQFSFVSD